MAEEKKKHRRSYLSDFQMGSDGKYVYRGKFHVFLPGENGAGDRRHALAKLWLLTALMGVAVLIAGCLPVNSMRNSAYVILPYAATLLAVISVVWLMCRLSVGGDPLRDYVYKATVPQIRPRGILSFAFSICTLAGEAFFLILHGLSEETWGTVAFVLCVAAVTALSFVWRRKAEKLRWSKGEEPRENV